MTKLMCKALDVARATEMLYYWPGNIHRNITITDGVMGSDREVRERKHRDNHRLTMSPAGMNTRHKLRKDSGGQIQWVHSMYKCMEGAVQSSQCPLLDPEYAECYRRRGATHDNP